MFFLNCLCPWDGLTGQGSLTLVRVFCLLPTNKGLQEFHHLHYQIFQWVPVYENNASVEMQMKSAHLRFYMIWGYVCCTSAGFFKEYEAWVSFGADDTRIPNPVLLRRSA